MAKDTDVLRELLEAFGGVEEDVPEAAIRAYKEAADAAPRPSGLKAQSEAGQRYIDERFADADLADLPQDAIDQEYNEMLFYHVGKPGLAAYDLDAPRATNDLAPPGMWTYADKGYSDAWLDRAKGNVEQHAVVTSGKEVFVPSIDKPTEGMIESYKDAVLRRFDVEYDDLNDSRKAYIDGKVDYFARLGVAEYGLIPPEEIRKVYTDNGIDILLNGDEVLHLNPEKLRKPDAMFDPMMKGENDLNAFQGGSKGPNFTDGLMDAGYKASALMEDEEAETADTESTDPVDDQSITDPEWIDTSEKLTDMSPEEYFTKVLDVATDFTPIIGEIKSGIAAYEDYQEGDNVGAGVNAVGAIPFYGSVGRGITKAANWISDIFGNAKVSSRTDDVLEGADPYEAAGITKEEVAAWKKENTKRNPFQQSPEVAELAEKLRSGEISSDEFRAIAHKISKPTIFEEVPKVPSLEGLVKGLESGKPEKGVIGLNKSLEDGTRVATRLDIPAYRDFDTWVVSVHASGGTAGKSIGYAQTAKLEDVNFLTKPSAAILIAAEAKTPKGTKYPKTPFARMEGSWVNHDAAEVVMDAEKLLKDPEWVQVGMNPYRASYFYDKKTMEPLESAEELIQVGPLVLAKGVKRGNPNDAKYRINSKDKNSPTFSEGGLMSLDSRGEEMKPKFNCGGMLEVISMGGLMGDDMIIGHDPVSGNPIPPGSNAENVRDDIPAALSDGEYVVPADVVRYHGLKTFMNLRAEAKMGLMAMHEEGQIVEVETDEDEEDDVHVTPEGNEVEVAKVETEEETLEEEVEAAEGGDVRKGYLQKERMMQAAADAAADEMAIENGYTPNPPGVGLASPEEDPEIPDDYVDTKAQAAADAAADEMAAENAIVEKVIKDANGNEVTVLYDTINDEIVDPDEL